MANDQRAALAAELAAALRVPVKQPARKRCDCSYRLDTNGYCKMCGTYPFWTGRPEKMSLSDQIYESRDFGSMADSAARD